MDRLKELDNKKLKWIVVLAVLMMVGMFCIAFAFVAARTGTWILLVGMVVVAVVDVGSVVWIVRKKFGEMQF